MTDKTKEKEIIENLIKKELSEWNNDLDEHSEWFRIRCIEFYELGKKLVRKERLEKLGENGNKV